MVASPNLTRPSSVTLHPALGDLHDQVGELVHLGFVVQTRGSEAALDVPAHLPLHVLVGLPLDHGMPGQHFLDPQRDVPHIGVHVYDV